MIFDFAVWKCPEDQVTVEPVHPLCPCAMWPCCSRAACSAQRHEDRWRCLCCGRTDTRAIECESSWAFGLLQGQTKWTDDKFCFKGHPVPLSTLDTARHSSSGPGSIPSPWEQRPVLNLSDRIHCSFCGHFFSKLWDFRTLRAVPTWPIVAS